MQTSLTWVDMGLSLLLGIAGSLIAAYLFLYAPSWFSKASSLWAERSKKAMAAKVNKLTKELDQITVFQRNPAELIGRTFSIIARSLFYAVMSLMLALGTFAAKADYSLDSIRVKLGLLDSAYLSGINDPRIVTILFNGQLIGSLVLAATGMLPLLKVVGYRSLDRRLAALQSEISRLRDRLNS